jgi:hypothetical protein
MPIVRMISRDPTEFRAFQSRMTTVGKIRLGQYVTPEGQRGRPVKLGTLRFTSPTEALIRAIAELYGGEVRQWTPQGSKTAQWEVISDADAVPVYIVNGQRLDPSYEAWAGGRTCVRRCDGEINRIDDSPCVCNDPDPKVRPAQKDLCKITLRVQVMLHEVPGIGSWMLETHGENAAAEISMFDTLVSRAPMPIPAVLHLRKDVRREWNPDKRGGAGFETKDFYVPWFEVFGVTAQQVAIGGDALTQALAAAGAPALLGGDRRAIEAAPPMSAPPATVPQSEPDPNGGARVPLEEFRRILEAIEGALTVDRLEGIKEGLAKRNVRYKAIMEAWVSKRAALVAAEGMAGGADHYAAEQAQAERYEAEEYADREPHDDAEPDYHVGDTVEVGGITFTKISEGATVEDVFGTPPVEGTVEGDGSDLPQVPDVPYDRDEQWLSIVSQAGKRQPPLTTLQVVGLVVGVTGVSHLEAVTAHQLAQVAQAMRTGAL